MVWAGEEQKKVWSEVTIAPKTAYGSTKADVIVPIFTHKETKA